MDNELKIYIFENLIDNGGGGDREIIIISGFKRVSVIFVIVTRLNT